jgi:sugar phosphate isomerase/epimerase
MPSSDADAGSRRDGRKSIRIGICSVTLRAHAPADVIRLSAAAGLESIEWGADVHVPPGDPDTANAVGESTRAAGLAVCSYGSYLGDPWGRSSGADIDAVVATAVALGAPRIRVWAGPRSSAAATADDRRAVISRIRRVAALAAAEGIGVALEYHAETLADGLQPTIRILDEVDAPNVSTYWQPRVGASDADALADLAGLGERVSTIHVFSWDAAGARHPLRSRADLWRAALDRAAAMPLMTDALLEFLPGDDPGLLAGEARDLRTWTDEAAGVRS